MGQFESDMEKRLNSFNIEPSAQVWEAVEAVLHEKSRRRFVAWWWMPVAGLMLLAFGWWMLGKRDMKQEQVAIAKNGTVASSNQPTARKMKEEKTGPVETKKSADEVIAEKGVSGVLENPVKESKPTNSSIAFQQKNKAQIKSRTGKIAAKENGIAGADDEKEAGKAVVQSTSMDAVEQNHISLVAVEKKADSLTKKDTVSIAVIKKETPLANDSSEAMKQLKKTTEPTKKQQWYFTVGGGVSLVREGNLLSSNSMGDYPYNSSISSQPTGIVGSSSTNKKLPNTGSFISAGIHYSRNLSKYWDGLIGLQYRYLQNKQTDGADSLLATNHVHWLEVPVNVQYTINPLAQNKFQIVAGASMAWTFSEKWLVVPTGGNYYYDKPSNRGFMLNLNAGISMQTKNGFRYTLMGEQSLTPIHKLNSYKYYWNQWGLQMSVPVSSLLGKTRK